MLVGVREDGVEVSGRGILKDDDFCGGTNGDWCSDSLGEL